MAMEQEPHLSAKLHWLMQDWGQVDYPIAVERQLELVRAVGSGIAPETIVFCTHPPIVTLGRASRPEDISGWQGAVYESSRGGRATYHGPSQLVIYPILDLSREEGGRPFVPRSIHAYLRWLEQVVVRAVQAYGVEAEARTTELKSDGDKLLQLTGVWVGERKLASIGVAVRKWVTYHGVAINLDQDVQAFQGIQPCGYKPQTMVSLEELSGRKVCRQEFQEAVISSI